MSKFRQLLLSFLITTITTTCALAQSNLTQIRDTIYNSNGSPFNGTVVITWVGFSTPTSGTVSPLSTSARIYNGALSVLLVPSTTAAAGSFYQVVYYSSDGTTTWTEQWSVPPSSNALSVSGVRTATGTPTGTGTGTGSGTYATLPIAISQVTGLSDDLSTTSSAVAALTATVNGVQATVTGVNSTVTSLSSTVSALGSTVTSLGNTIASLQAGGTGTGGGQLAIAFVDGETPSGTLNGSNAVFTLSKPPTPALSLELYRNGLVQTSGVDYVLSGPQITFLAGAIPVSSDLLTAYYRVAGSSPAAAFADDETPTGNVNGSNTAFTLANIPNPAISLKLYKNGMLLQQTADYTLSGAAITFAAASAPQAGDLITAYYRH